MRRLLVLMARARREQAYEEPEPNHVLHERCLCERHATAGCKLGHHMQVQGVDLPPFLYGTAWKEDQTAQLVATALAAGFRGIDTANQRKHYHEAGVGEALKSSDVARDELFLQTKFTSIDGQDARLPYDAAADDATQVRQSFESSLSHLGVTWIDSLLIHGPTSRRGLSSADRAVWQTMEQLHDEQRVRLIGISNVSAAQVEELCAIARVRPAFVQNRCFASTGWDRDVREVCAREGIIYQGFSLLTANRRELAAPEIRAIAEAHRKTIAQVVFRFAIQLGMLPLTGTTDAQHMREDLDVFGFELSDEEMQAIERISTLSSRA